MSLLWSKAEQQERKKVSENMINLLFDRIASEVQAVDLRKLLGDEFYNDMINRPDYYEDLLDGTTYVKSGVTYTVAGLKSVLSYYFYARYIAESSVQDTFSGMVHHNMDDNTRVNMGYIKNMQGEAYKVAEAYWSECVGLMTETPAYYPYFNCKTTNKIKFRTL
jgi:hypothetical protein